MCAWFLDSELSTCFYEKSFSQLHQNLAKSDIFIDGLCLLPLIFYVFTRHTVFLVSLLLLTKKQKLDPHEKPATYCGRWND